jgi:DNA (cytosine-5)-methyltransferase 1
VALPNHLQTAFSFPAPTHSVELPSGYNNTIAHALSVVGRAFEEPPAASKDLPTAISVKDAIADLPIIRDHLDGSLRRGARRFNTPLPRRVKIRAGSYAETMYRWPRFEGSDVLLDHVIRSLSDRDFRIFREMDSGEEYPAARKRAEQLFEDALVKRGWGARPHDAEWRRLHKAFVPPYDPGKFPNKWRKMEPKLPARTLMAHLGKDSYSHIHYDSEQARTISVREAARLQSFPDGFIFRGAMNAAFRQIGNSVPPLMAFALALALRAALPEAAADQESAAVQQSLTAAQR